MERNIENRRRNRPIPLTFSKAQAFLWRWRSRRRRFSVLKQRAPPAAKTASATMLASHWRKVSDIGRNRLRHQALLSVLLFAASAPAQQEVITKYCTGCHNDKLRTGGIVLDPAS